MFQDNQVWGVFLAIAFIIGCLVYIRWTNRGLAEEDKPSSLGQFIVVMLCSIWGVDKVIAFKTPLLTEKESEAVFAIMIMVVATLMERSKKTKV